MLLAQSFDPTGSAYQRAGADITTYGWAGEQADENGLVYLRARFYAPGMGRFLNTDPSRAELNPYQYSLSNPVLHTDPSGNCVFFVLDTIICGGIVIGAVTAAAWDVFVLQGRGGYPIDQMLNPSHYCGVNWGEVGAFGAFGGVVGGLTAAGAHLAIQALPTVAGQALGQAAVWEMQVGQCLANPTCAAPILRAIATWSLVDFADDAATMIMAANGNQDAANQLMLMSQLGILDGPNALIAAGRYLDEASAIRPWEITSQYTGTQPTWIHQPPDIRMQQMWLPGMEPEIPPPTGLVNSEGFIGSYIDMTGTTGITPHHMPSGAYMLMLERSGRLDYDYNYALTFNMEIMRHTRTHNWRRRLSPEYATLSPRQALAFDILDVRRIYMQDQIYDGYIRGQLTSFIRLMQENNPGVFGR